MTRNISEADTRANYIDPKLIESDWTSDNIKREYYFTDGRKLLGNKRMVEEELLFQKGRNSRTMVILSL